MHLYMCRETFFPGQIRDSSFFSPVDKSTQTSLFLDAGLRMAQTHQRELK